MPNFRVHVGLVDFAQHVDATKVGGPQRGPEGLEVKTVCGTGVSRVRCRSLSLSLKRSPERSVNVGSAEARRLRTHAVVVCQRPPYCRSAGPRREWVSEVSSRVFDYFGGHSEVTGLVHDPTVWYRTVRQGRAAYD